ncbi:hypothetical protein XANCAGTX0491_008252 [Xanthoria calcicola]
MIKIFLDKSLFCDPIMSKSNTQNLIGGLLWLCLSTAMILQLQTPPNTALLLSTRSSHACLHLSFWPRDMCQNTRFDVLGASNSRVVARALSISNGKLWFD